MGYSGSSGMTSVLQDPSPQLGGDLDPNGHNIGPVTPEELGYLQGVSGPLQAQLDAKLEGEHNHDGAYAAADHNHDGAYAAADHNHDEAYPGLLSGTADPDAAPARVGLIYLNTASSPRKAWVSVGTAAVDDWLPIG